MTEFVNVLASANKKRRLRTILPWGDSITASASIFVGQVNPTTVGTVTSYYSGYAETLIRAAKRFIQVSNAGFPGQNNAAILARFEVDVLPFAPDAVLIMMGTNNFVAGMTDAQMTAALQDCERAVLKCLQHGILPILVTPPPKNSNPLAARVYASYLYDIADYYEVPLIDLHRLLVDPTTGNYASGTTLSADGTHPTDAAITLIASQFASALAAIENYQPPVYMDPVSNSVGSTTLTNLIPNGNFARVTSSPTPDGWSVNAAGATQTLGALSASNYPYTGNEFRYVLPSDGDAYALYGQTLNVVAGNKIRLSGSLSVSGQAAGTSKSCHLGGDFDTGSFRPIYNWHQNGDVDFSAEYTVPAGQSHFTPTFYLQAAGTYKVRNLTLVDLTARAALYAPGSVTV